MAVGIGKGGLPPRPAGRVTPAGVEARRGPATLRTAVVDRESVGGG